MRTRKMRLVSALLAVAMLFVMMPVGAFAADAVSFTVGGVQYSINDDNKSVTIVGYDEAALPEDLDIPNTVSYDNAEYSVVKFTTSTPGAFYNCNKLKSVKIPDSIETMGQQTFLRCSNLSDVTFKGQSHFKYIGYQVFGQCTSLESIVIPSSVIGFGIGTFSSSTALKNVVFTGDFQTITEQAFNNCQSLESITLPASVTKICKDAFKDCTKLKRINYKGTKEQWNAINFDNSNEEIKSLVRFAHGVTFEMNGHGTALADQTVYTGDPITEIAEPTAAGYTFAGWYTDKALTQKFDVENDTITGDTTLYAKWEPIPDHELTVKGGTFTFDDNAAADKGSVYEGAVVTVTLDENDPLWKDSGLSFDHWDIQSKATLLDENGAEIVNPGKTFTFVMPEEGVTVEAVPKTAPAEDDSLDAATVVTGVVLGTGTAILAYHIGTELYAEQVLGKNVAVPKTREDVALKAWELAGKPAVELNGEPLSEAAQAEKWAVESGLMQNDAEGNFNGAKKMNKLKALRVLDAAKKLA